MKECPGPLKIMSAKKLTSLYIWRPEFSLTPVQKQDIHKNICRLTMYSTDQYVLVTWLWSINIHHMNGSVTIPIIKHSILSNYKHMFSPWLLIVQSSSLKKILQHNAICLTDRQHLLLIAGFTSSVTHSGRWTGAMLSSSDTGPAINCKSNSSHSITNHKYMSHNKGTRTEQYQSLITKSKLKIVSWLWWCI